MTDEKIDAVKDLVPILEAVSQAAGAYTRPLFSST